MRIFSILTLLLLLTGCGGSFPEMDNALALRQQLLSSEGCSFEAVVTADYGETVHVFGMQCTGQKDGSISFEVTDPETISGITGSISDDGGKLTYDGLLLSFHPLAEGQLSPVYAPWIMLQTLRSGYISGCGKDGNGVCISIDDTFAEEAVQIQIWTDSENRPLRCEIVWKNRRILSVDVRSFVYL